MMNIKDELVVFISQLKRDEYCGWWASDEMVNRLDDAITQINIKQENKSGKDDPE